MFTIHGAERTAALITSLTLFSFFIGLQDIMRACRQMAGLVLIVIAHKFT